jgi:hypothetical protein
MMIQAGLLFWQSGEEVELMQSSLGEEALKNVPRPPCPPKREDDLEAPEWKCPSGSGEVRWAYIDATAPGL